MLEISPSTPRKDCVRVAAGKDSVLQPFLFTRALERLHHEHRFLLIGLCLQGHDTGRSIQYVYYTMKNHYVVILCSSFITIGFFAGFLSARPVKLANSEVATSARSALETNSAHEPSRADNELAAAKSLPPVDENIIHVLGRRGSNVPPGKLLEEIMRTFREVEDLPYATKAAAWGSYLTACISLAEFDEVVQLALAPDAEFVKKLKAEKALMGGSLWDDLMGRCVFQFGKLNRIAEIIRKAESQFESGDDLLQSNSASITAAIYGPRSLTDIQQLNSLTLAYQTAVKGSLLDRWSKFNRVQGVKFLLSENNGYLVSEKAVESILNKDWFLENANNLSQQIDRSPPSRNRDLMIAQMLRIIGNSDPTATNSWLNQISDATIRNGALKPISP